MLCFRSLVCGNKRKPLDVNLSCLQLIHSSVIDTAIVFPHRIGLPYKRALRNLMAEHLKRIIQDNGGEIAQSLQKWLCCFLKTIFH